MAFDPGFCFDVPLLDLGNVGRPEMAGILTPEPEVGRKKVGVTDQFLANAEEYHDRYSSVPYFKNLIREAIDRTGSSLNDAVLLDIGSGSGNSVLPCLELFERASIVAVDISPDLLRILQKTLSSNQNQRDRVALVCMDATRDHFKPNRFDLTIGTAILHHLVDPKATLVAAGKALKPGAHAIFFEPFENGNVILCLAYKEILREARSRWRKIDRPARKALKVFVRNIETRAKLMPGSRLLRKLDDKWLFTRSFLEDTAEEAGFSEIAVYPTHPTEKPFSERTESFLRLYGEIPVESLPSWAWAILNYYDTAFSDGLKREWITEGTIILSKG